MLLRWADAVGLRHFHLVAHSFGGRGRAARGAEKHIPTFLLSSCAQKVSESSVAWISWSCWSHSWAKRYACLLFRRSKRRVATKMIYFKVPNDVKR